jgi:nitronate monooxygenase
MPLRTRLTELLAIRHPVVLAPMGGTAIGKLAAAVSEAGGLGLIGRGRSDAEWLRREFVAAGNQCVGCGLSPGGSPSSPSCSTVHSHTHRWRSCSLLGTPRRSSLGSNRQAFR